MKLPDMQTGGVQKFAVEPAGQAANAARAAIGADSAMADMLGKAGEFTTDMAELMIQRQVTNTKVETGHASNEIERSYADTKYISAKDVPESYQVVGGRTKEVPDGKGGFQTVDRNIPKWEVYPEIYRDEMTAVIKEKSSHISSRTHRKTFEENALLALDDQYTKMNDNRFKAAKRQTMGEEGILIDEGLRSGHYDASREVINSSVVFDSNQKKEINNKINLQQETDAIDTSMLESDVPLMMDFLADLTDSETYKGYLNDAERLTYVKALSGSLRASKVASTEAVKTSHKLLRLEMTDTITGVKDGQQFSPQHLNEVYAKAIEAFKVDPSGMAVPLKKYADMIRYQPEVRAIQVGNEIAVEKTLSALRANQNKDSESANKLRIFEGVNAAKNSAVNSDALSYANSVGLVKLSELDLTSMDTMAAGIGKRVPAYTTTRDQYGQAQGLLTKDEATSVAGQVNRMTNQEKVDFAARMNHQLGKESTVLWRQLGQESNMKSFGIAGRIASDGDRGQATRIIEGKQVRKDNPSLIKDINNSAIPKIRKKLDGMYSETPRYGDAVVEAILDEYALQLYEANDFSGGGSVPQEAIDAVVGSTIEYNGSKIENVSRTADADELSNWIGVLGGMFTYGGKEADSLAPEYIDSLGGVKGYTSEQLIYQIIDGTVKLKSAGKGQYFLHRPDRDTNQRFMMNETTGEPFVLIYDQGAPRGTITKDNQWNQ